jgi:hypothetical protein
MNLKKIFWIFFFLLIFVTVTRAITVTLAWTPSSDSFVAGYNIYYGEASGAYSTKISVGNVTNVSILNLVGGTTYYFVATSVNRSGLESSYSSEVNFNSSFELIIPYVSSDYKIVTITNNNEYCITNHFSHTNIIQCYPPGYIFTNIVRTNMSISIPIEGPWNLWASTNLETTNWFLYTTGMIPTTVDITLLGSNKPSSEFFKLSY